MTKPAPHPAYRCQYRNAAGRQCRSPHVGAPSRHCPRHAALEKQVPQPPSDLTKLFSLDHDKFQSPAGIHAALAELFTLLAEDRVSARRAAVLAYISSLLLRTLQQEGADDLAAAKKAPLIINWGNMPRPSHERHDTPHPPAPVAEAQQ